MKGSNATPAKARTTATPPNLKHKPGALGAFIAAIPSVARCFTCTMPAPIVMEVNALIQAGKPLGTICAALRSVYGIEIGTTTLGNHKRNGHHEKKKA